MLELSSELGILVLLFCISSYTIVAKRLSSSLITAPMVFISVGLLLSLIGFFTNVEIAETTHLIAEIALFVLLFLDASQINIKHLKYRDNWPLRMLLLGLPLSILFGTLVGLLLFPNWPWTLIALVAAIMSPTDAALGDAVFKNKSIPVNIRQTLTIESGLNDGLALPFILFFASLVTAATNEHSANWNWLIFGGSQVLVGILVGTSMGWLSGKIFVFAEERNLTTSLYEGIGVLALTGTSYLTASILGGNGFISAFVAGLAFGNVVKGHCRFIYQFSESEGQLLVWSAFTAIGLGLLPEAIRHLSWPIVGYIFISLFLVRPLAIYISLIGAKIPFVSKLFLGWFGPRGLATALFALLVSKDLLDEYSQSILVVAINGVWISAVLHGVTATPLGKWYGHYTKAQRSKNRD
ncbi:MAG: cation:proton antiporter [Paraglaciecola sp.]|uniref:cation:proton antiporter n=1 Tax=Paraglaciecola sp. TaxID=1920173 RepID=UPI00329887A2